MKNLVQKSLSLVKIGKDQLIDLVFPKFCFGCQKEGESVCAHCLEKILPVVSQICPECQKLSPKGAYHPKCRKGKALKGIIAAAYFEEGPTREMIHNLKYNGIVSLAEPLSGLMVETLVKSFPLSVNRHQTENGKQKTENLVICPVPLHWRRQAQRGYNQAEVLANLVSQKTGLKCLNLLTKVKSTPRQVGLRGQARRENLENVFLAKKGINVRGKKIVLIDDVYTTGTTLDQCAKVLKKAGAREVWGLVVARG